MDKWIARLRSGILPFLCFIGGVALGILLVFVFRAGLKKKRGSNKTSVRAADISGATNDALDYFFRRETGLDFKSKTQMFCAAVDRLCGEIASLYYLDGVKKYRLLEGSSWTGSGFETPLEFDIFELIAFFDSLLCTVQTALENAVKSDKFMRAYSAYRIVNRKIAKDPTEAKLATIVAVFYPPVREETSAVKRFFAAAVKKVAAPVVRYGIRKLEPSVVEVSDGFYAACLKGVAEDINFLYSHNFAKGVGKPTDALSEEEEAV